jgi:hypothetical protein
MAPDCSPERCSRRRQTQWITVLLLTETLPSSNQERGGRFCRTVESSESSELRILRTMKVSIPLSWFPAIVFISTVHCASFWVHKDCRGLRPEWDAIQQQALELARIAREKAENDQSTSMSTYFRQLFGASSRSDVVGKISSLQERISNG